MRATTVSSTSLLLRWLTLTIVLLAFGSAAAEDQHPLDLDATRTALTAIEAALKDKDLADADLQRLRSENDPFGVALQAAIAEMTPRLEASAKRLTELTPKSKDPAQTTDAATAELVAEKAKHDALDARLAHSAGHAARGRRQRDADQRRQTAAVCAPDLRQIGEPPQSAALG